MKNKRESKNRNKMKNLELYKETEKELVVE